MKSTRFIVLATFRLTKESGQDYAKWRFPLHFKNKTQLDSELYVTYIHGSNRIEQLHNHASLQAMSATLAALRGHDRALWLLVA